MNCSLLSFMGLQMLVTMITVEHYGNHYEVVSQAWHTRVEQDGSCDHLPLLGTSPVIGLASCPISRFQTKRWGRRCCAPSTPRVAAESRQPSCVRTCSLVITGGPVGVLDLPQNVVTSYLEMLQQQAMVMELSGGQSLTKYAAESSVRRMQPDKSSTRRYTEPMVRY